MGSAIKFPSKYFLLFKQLIKIKHAYYGNYKFDDEQASFSLKKHNIFLHLHTDYLLPCLFQNYFLLQNFVINLYLN